MQREGTKAEGLREVDAKIRNKIRKASKDPKELQHMEFCDLKVEKITVYLKGILEKSSKCESLALVECRLVSL